MEYFYLLIVSLFSSLLTAFAIYILLRKKISQKTDMVTGLLKDKVDQVVDIFRGEIPMAASLLSGNLLTKLKEKSYKEVFKLVPSLVKKMFDLFSISLFLFLGVLFGILAWAILATLLWIIQSQTQ